MGLLRSPWLWVTITIASLGNVGLAPMQVALPKLIKDVYGQGVWLLCKTLCDPAVGGEQGSHVGQRAKSGGGHGALEISGEAGQLAGIVHGGLRGLCVCAHNDVLTYQ